MFSEFRYIKIKKDKPKVNAVYGKLKDKDDWKIQALRFPKSDDWSVETAKTWVKDHPDILKTIEDTELVFMLGEEDVSEQVTVDVFALDAVVVSEKLLKMQDTLVSVVERLDAMEAKFAEEPTKEVPKAIDKNEEIENTTEVLSEEKMAELVEAFKKEYHSEPSFEEVRGLFEEMNSEIREKFSVQS
jgi:hypothetical protein